MKRISEDIKQNTFSPAYLLYGEEAYLRQDIKKRLIQTLVPDGDSMNYTVFSGKDVTEGEIIAQAVTMPFFAERRVILVEETGFFKRKSEELADFIKEIPTYLILIFCESEVDKRGRLYKAVGKAGHIAEFSRQKSDVLMRWILGRIAKEGKKIRRTDLELFMELTGDDMGRISQELEKLLCYTMDQDVIETEDIKAVVSVEVRNQIFDMVRAVAEHHQKQALHLYYELLALKEAPMRILFLLAREYRQLYLIKSLLTEGTDQKTIAAKVGLPPFVVRKYIPLVRRYRAEELQKTIEEFVDTETEVKTGRLPDVMSVELMIIKCSAGY
jgi:DNA polymerase-3 subunit delta